MGLLGKGLLGLLLGSDNRGKQMPSYLRNQPETYGQRESAGSWWECAYCGKRVHNTGKNRPPVSFGGGCKSSPYGSHLFREI